MNINILSDCLFVPAFTHKLHHGIKRGFNVIDPISETGENITMVKTSQRRDTIYFSTRETSCSNFKFI